MAAGARRPPIARLAPGASIGQASAELSRIAADLARQFPNTNTGMEAGVGPLRAFLVGDRALTLWLLLAAVGVLQLIACTNVANLMLSRSALRQQELALRIALGAGRMRLVRHALAESVVLTTAGVVLGLAIGFAGLHALGTLYPPSLDSPVFRSICVSSCSSWASAAPPRFWPDSGRPGARRERPRRRSSWTAAAPARRDADGFSRRTPSWRSKWRSQCCSSWPQG